MPNKGYPAATFEDRKLAAKTNEIIRGLYDAAIKHGDDDDKLYQLLLIHEYIIDDLIPKYAEPSDEVARTSKLKRSCEDYAVMCLDCKHCYAATEVADGYRFGGKAKNPELFYPTLGEKFVSEKNYKDAIECYRKAGNGHKKRLNELIKNVEASMAKPNEEAEKSEKKNDKKKNKEAEKSVKKNKEAEKRGKKNEEVEKSECVSLCVCGGGVTHNNLAKSRFDLLDWWKRRETEFSILSIMAQEILVVPTSTFPVESAFSEGGYMLDERRSRMIPKNLEAQMMLKDATKAELRDQENRWDDLLADQDTFQEGITKGESSQPSQTDDQDDDDIDFD
ncbi:hypothetical protein OROGR_012012 [Orobanche gracilis]